MLAANAILVLASFSAIDTPQLYHFTSTSCPACRQVEPTIAELKDQGVPIVRVDVSQRREWAQQAQVHALPTFIAVAHGQEVGRLVGAVSFRDLSQLYLKAIHQHAKVKQSKSQQRSEAVEIELVSTNAQRNPRHSTADARNTTSSRSEEMVRGQNPMRPRPSERLRGAFESLTGRDELACSQCRGKCQCTSGNRQISTIAPVKNPPSANAPSQTCVDDALAATVKLKIVDELGQSFGTGTIIDVHEDEALVLTCGHIFRESEGKGRVLCDSFAPGAKPEIKGKLISYDIRRDVGLVSFRPGVPVQSVAIGGTGERPKDNDQIFSIGCNHGNDPTVMRNRIIAINRYHGPPNIVAGGRPVDGRSGGGLFSADGMLIGVCNAADPEYDEGLYAALGNVHAELDAVGLGFIYRQQQPEIALGNVRNPEQPLRPGDGGRPSDIRNERKADPILPVSGPPARELQDRGTVPDDPPEARVEPESDRSSAQLIANIRWPENPDSQVELIIERPSRDLLNQLSREANNRGPHRQTQLQVKHNRPTDAGGWRSLAPD